MVAIFYLLVIIIANLSNVSPHVLLEKSSTSDLEDDLVAVEKHAGLTAKLRCNSATVHRVHWTKNGKRLSCSKGGCRPTLKITNLSLDDDGLYQCWLPPGLPANPAYDLKVIVPRKETEVPSVYAGVAGPPEIEGPGNLSVPLGAAVALRCSIVSSLPPNIQWLRLLPDYPLEQGHKHRKVLEYEGAMYEVLTPSGVAALSNNTWLTKLVLAKLNKKDSGYYVCVATNNHGFQFRGGFVTVMEKSPSISVDGGGQSEVLYIEVVLIATVFMLFATIALALIYLAHWNRRHRHVANNL
ncbi:fibroblast growth factor receptor 1 [Neocloeon triangulifer]|uniref:fibroblast growth factor receptor 1 n=1 Tax=Neocloeon triangulifer TaxID=2078957 RepID=UPI00286F08AA|nr:fibroblast growth factor receptor 1 [Neocloeon triangulifer]